MSDGLITHIRHVDLAVPDFAKQRDFYRTTWGLTEVVDENGLGDMWDLDELAADCAADGSYEFLLTAAPLNPIAMR